MFYLNKSTRTFYFNLFLLMVFIIFGLIFTKSASAQEPVFYCAGGINCVPSISPTQTVANPYVSPTIFNANQNISPTPASTTAPLNSQAPNINLSPTPNCIPAGVNNANSVNEVMTAKKKSNRGGSTEGLLAKILELLKQIMELLKSIIGGGGGTLPNFGVPGVLNPTQSPEQQNPTGALNPTSAQNPGGQNPTTTLPPCPTNTPSVQNPQQNQPIQEGQQATPGQAQPIVAEPTLVNNGTPVPTIVVGGGGNGNFKSSGPSSAKRAGVHAGVSMWTLPNTPNGLKPSQTWGGPGVTPNGDVYIGGMDHKTNSALYRLYNDTIYYVGDAKSASEQASNWKPGEVAEKFHTRPTWLNGSIYVATMNTSELNNNYLSKPGFHWYGYDITGNKFTDLNTALPGGIAAEHGSIVTLAPDVSRNILYGAMHPTGDLYAYFPSQKKSVKLGRPAYNRALVYPGRWMWVDNSNGRLYFTAGNDAISYYGGSYDPAIFNHVHYYDPQSGFGEMKNWTLHNQRAIDGGQCANGTCYMMDNKGHVYRFTQAGPSWSYIGQVANLPASSTTEITWVFSVDFAKSLAYVVVSGPTTLYEFNLQTGASQNLGNLESFEPELQKYSVLYGHDAWSNGVFYFAALGTDPNLNLSLVGIDPVKYKQAIGK